MHCRGATRCPARLGGNGPSALPRLVSAQVGFVLAGGAAWGNKAAGSLRPFATQGAAPRPGRRLPARAPLVHRGGYPDHEYPECPEYGEKTQENERRGQVMLGIGSGTGRRGPP
jgi:hypothetical protein